MREFKKSQKKFEAAQRRAARAIEKASMPLSVRRPTSSRRSGMISSRRPRRTKEEIAADKALRAEEVALNKAMRAQAKAERKAFKEAEKAFKKATIQNARARLL